MLKKANKLKLKNLGQKDYIRTEKNLCTCMHKCQVCKQKGGVYIF